ncbi:formimidoylglutamase [Salegentibacter sp. HM20]
MDQLKIYRFRDIEKLISKREGETKFGEALHFVNELKDLGSCPAKIVLLGIAEDIGVRANHGKAGTSKAWEAALSSLLNIQKNEFNSPGNICLLGELSCEVEMEKAGNIDVSDPNYFKKLGDLVAAIDEKVSDLISEIVAGGKFPIIIGGGHNNAFGNIRGTALALKKPINVMNIDAHTDLRRLEHRHSGNGFSYAREEGFLEKYSVFGLAKNYTPQYIFDEMKLARNMNFKLMEELLGKNPSEIIAEFEDSLEFVRDDDFGLELDCDAISGFPSSAQTPSGLDLNTTRQLLEIAIKKPECRYLHICEAAPKQNSDFQTGKALGFFISDANRAFLER